MPVDTTFKATDDVLRQLVTERREEVVQLQKGQADHIKDIETRGQGQIVALRRTLPKEINDILDTLDKRHDEATGAAKGLVDSAKQRLRDSRPADQHATPVHPGLIRGQLIAPNSVGWFTPYYATLHGSDGSVYWQGYGPGALDLWHGASGSGSGLFGTGAGSFTVYLDWWFTYAVPANRYYSHTIWVPYHGFYILYANDGFWDSKEAHARMDLSAVGYQYNYKPTSTTNVFDMGSQNINVNDRYDGYRTMYYSDLLGTDQAYLRVTASFYVYARGGGSAAQLNFSDGDANYMGLPWIYVD